MCCCWEHSQPNSEQGLQLLTQPKPADSPSNGQDHGEQQMRMKESQDFFLQQALQCTSITKLQPSLVLNFSFPRRNLDPIIYNLIMCLSIGGFQLLETFSSLSFILFSPLILDICTDAIANTGFQQKPEFGSCELHCSICIKLERCY